MGKATVAVGLQFGDEGKGKIIDCLSEEYDYVARFYGGANAGHTVSFDGKTFKLNLIPSGIFNPKAYNFLCSGMVIDPEKFTDEIIDLQKKNISIERLRISARAHIIMPWHKIIDAAKDAALGKQAIGTTGRGIGPCYADKASRIGIRVGELLDVKRLTEHIEWCYKLKEKEISLFENAKLPPLAQIIDDFKKHACNLSSFIADTEEKLRRALKNDNKKILLEGAQGAMIDIDNGTYPFVTSSSATSAGACVGAGLPPTAIDEIYGIAKAYITRVGNGPFVTELNDEIGETLRKNGNEFGTTTGRPRRCGWFDVPLARYTAELNGVTGIILTKLDVLTGISPIKVATAYRRERMILPVLSPMHPLEECRPFYEEFEGWKEPIANVDSWDKLPPQAQRYVEELEKLIGFPIIAVATGPDRKAIIERR